MVPEMEVEPTRSVSSTEFECFTTGENKGERRPLLQVHPLFIHASPLLRCDERQAFL